MESGNRVRDRMLQWPIVQPEPSPPRMQIAVFLTGAFAVIGGVHTFNRALLWALDALAARHDWQVDVFSLLDGGDLQREARPYMPSGRTRFTGFSGSKGRFAVSASLAARQAHATILGHRNFLPLAPLLGETRRLLIVHGIEAWHKLSRLQRAGLGNISTFLSVSDFTARTMAAANGLSKQKFVRFPNTLDPFYAADCTSNPARASLGLPTGPMMLTVSRLDLSERYKNIDLVVRAMPEVIRQVPGAFYVIVGEGADRPRLEALARQHGVAERVFFTGRVSDSDLSAYHQTSDLFVLPSLKEGFGIVFLEAMYYGKACIGAHAGGIPEVIDDGHTGLLVGTDTPEPLAQSIIRLLCDSKLRCEFGRNGRQRLQQEFSREAFCARLEAILCRCGNDSGSSAKPGES
jgi:phosphatidyl-myo-inositol dimannoside synthase